MLTLNVNHHWQKLQHEQCGGPGHHCASTTQLDWWVKPELSSTEWETTRDKITFLSSTFKSVIYLKTTLLF